MIKSMTGFGKASLDINQRQYQIEIKTVNHRYLDISIKMPRIISYLEDEVKKCITSKIKRGKVDVFITYKNNGTDGKSIKINKELAKKYIEQLRILAEEENLLANIEVTEISKFPDVLLIQADEDDELIKKEIVEVTNNAVERLIEMRQTEGNKIFNDLQARIEDIKLKNKEISKLSTGLIEEYVVKLEKRIKEILNTTTQEIDKTRLEQEVVIYADKCSVEEEVTRLGSHIYQLKDLLKSDETVGKKLDFLIQEMNREINTIGSKANNLKITNYVVDVKTQIENIREQVQNIE